MLESTITLSKTLVAASLGAALFTAAPAAMAEDADGMFNFSANAAIVSEYRFRGISMSNRDFAIQGGLDISTDSGFYVGTWGSSIESFAGAETEIDIYGGYTGQAAGLTYDIGLLAYTYPGSVDTAYLEGYASISGALQKMDWTLGYAYAFSQSNLGDQDNSYVYVDAAFPLGDTGASLSGHLAYENGAFGDNKWDWSAGVSYPVGAFEATVAYVDTNIESFGLKTVASGAVVFSLGASF